MFILYRLAAGIGQCHAIKFQALCGIFNIPVADLLQYHRMMHYLSKFELIAKIRKVASKSAMEGSSHIPDQEGVQIHQASAEEKPARRDRKGLLLSYS
jgi:hypothetical protein